MLIAAYLFSFVTNPRIFDSDSLFSSCVDLVDEVAKCSKPTKPAHSNTCLFCDVLNTQLLVFEQFWFFLFPAYNYLMLIVVTWSKNDEVTFEIKMSLPNQMKVAVTLVKAVNYYLSHFRADLKTQNKVIASCSLMFVFLFSWKCKKFWISIFVLNLFWTHEWSCQVVKLV